MTNEQLNILNMLKHNNIRFIIVGSYVIRNYLNREIKDVDIIVHPDDESLLISTNIGKLVKNSKRTRYFLIQNCLIDIFVGCGESGINGERDFIDFNDSSYYNIDENGFKIITFKKLLDFCKLSRGIEHKKWIPIIESIIF